MNVTSEVRADVAIITVDVAVARTLAVHFALRVLPDPKALKER